MQCLGAVEAFNESKSFDLFLVGKEKKIIEVLSSSNLSFSKDFIVNADEVIEMGDSPASSLKVKTKLFNCNRSSACAG